MKQKRIIVKSSAGEYRVVCGTGALRGAGIEISRLDLKFSRIHVIRRPKSGVRWGRESSGASAKTAKSNRILMNDAEAAKNLTTAEKLSFTRARGNRPPLAPHRRRWRRCRRCRWLCGLHLPPRYRPRHKFLLRSSPKSTAPSAEKPASIFLKARIS